MGMQPDQQGVFFQVIIQGGGEFVYDASGNLRSANVGQVTTDPLQGITCQQGFSTFNGHGAVINLLSTSLGAFFQYQDLGTAVQGTMILAVAAANGTDPVTSTAYVAGMTGIDPVFGDFIVTTGARISMGIGTVITTDGRVSIQQAPTNAKNPYIQIDAPEQTTAEHAQILAQGASPDGTRKGQILVGEVASAGVLSPVTNAMMEVQGVTAPTSPALQIIAHAAADRAIGSQITSDGFNRLLISPGNAGGAFNEGPGTATQDVQFGRIAANKFGLTGCDLDVATAGRGLQIAEGSNARMGSSPLSGGTVTVANTSVTANTRIFLTAETQGANSGFLSVSARVAGTSFTIHSSNAADANAVAWLLVEPG